MTPEAGAPPRRVVPLGREEAAKLRQVVRTLAAGSPECVRELIALIDRREAASNAWRFGMVGLVEDEAVVYWIADNARRKSVTSKLWASCKTHIRTDTQEVLLDRRAMVQRVGAPSQHISLALAELVSIGALERRGTGRDARWFVSAKTATHLTGAARDQAQREAPPLLVGGR